MNESRLRRLLGALLGLVAVLFIAGCGSVANHPPMPSSVEHQSVRYKIGPLDTLSVVVWRNPDLSTTVTVRPDGFVSMPLVADIQAAGKTPAELAHEIEAAVSRLIRDPVVSVVVTGFQGVFSDLVRIVGEAAKPQAVVYRQDMTVLDVMIQVGGLTDFADGNGAVLIRGREGGKQYSVRLKDLLKRGDISANAPVVPGDIIIVPQSWF